MACNPRGTRCKLRDTRVSLLASSAIFFTDADLDPPSSIPDEVFCDCGLSRWNTR